MRQNDTYRLVMRLLLTSWLLCFGLAQDYSVLPVTFSAQLTGEQMLPAVVTTASGGATAVLVDHLLVVTGEYVGLSSEVFGQDSLRRVGLTGIVIHKAAPGEHGTIVRAHDTVYPGLRTWSLLNDGVLRENMSAYLSSLRGKRMSLGRVFTLSSCILKTIRTANCGGNCYLAWCSS